MKTFYSLLVNNGIAVVTNFTVWFAITFYVFLETKSVFATGIIAGLYLVLTAACAMWFGGIVDHHKKKTVMAASSFASAALYAVSAAAFFLAPEGSLSLVASPWFWAFVLPLMMGVIAGNLRTIAMPTIVTLLVPEEKRANANGLVGMVGGVAFGTVSVISGLLIAYTGFEGVYAVALALTLVSLAHLLLIRVPEEGIAHREEGPKKLDLKGTYALVMGVPGLLALIFFTTFNNFIGGAFMALMDAYGLSMVSVEMWGFILGALSFSFMLGGGLVAKFGLGKNPLRTMMLANLVIGATCVVYTIQPWLWLFIAGIFVYMCVFPYIEASEQTIIQKVVPYERQGRVFGFAQSVEQMASPVMAFLIAPLTEFLIIPLMTDGIGADIIGSWFGTGPARGIALVFVLCGIVSLAVTTLAFNSRSYKLLSKSYAEARTEEPKAA